MQTRNRQTGFTLVEIAIVLVIIGLLLGGILKGQELITQARIKNVMNDFNGITAAVNSYRDRYRAVPGDDPGVATRWSLTASPTAGNGVIEGTYNGAVTQETRLFWEHLRRAEFVSGNGTDLPTNAMSGILGVQTGDGSGSTPGSVMQNSDPGFGGLFMCSTSIPDKVAAAVDVQIDNGQPKSGRLRAVMQGGSPAVPQNIPGADPAAYAESGTTYMICQTI